MEWMLLPFRRYFDFSGRSRRMEFWMFQLLNVIVSLVFMLVMFGGVPFSELMNDTPPVDLGPDPTPGQIFGMFGPLFWVGGALYLIWGLAIFIPSIAVTIRRLHDRNMSSWWYAGLYIIAFIPIVNIFSIFGWIAFLVIMFLPGTDGPNRFGPDPKDPAQANVFA